MPLILVLFASIITPFSTIYAQPTGDLEANYYGTDNRSSNFDTFTGTIIETRTWDKIDTTNYNPQGRGDYWSVDIQGYIYIPSDGRYRFRTLSDDGVRLKVDGTTVINNWTLHALRYDYGNVTLNLVGNQFNFKCMNGEEELHCNLYGCPPTGGYVYPAAEYLSTSLPDEEAPTR